MTGLATVLKHHSLDEMAAALHRAEAELENAQRNYRKLSSEMAETLGYGEATVSFNFDDYDVTTSSSYFRSVDNRGVDSVSDMLCPETIENLFPLRRVLNLEAYLSLKQTDPGRFEIASRAVSIWAKPPIVKVIPRGAGK